MLSERIPSRKSLSGRPTGGWQRPCDHHLVILERQTTSNLRSTYELVVTIGELAPETSSSASQFRRGAIVKRESSIIFLLIAAQMGSNSPLLAETVIQEPPTIYLLVEILRPDADTLKGIG